MTESNGAHLGVEQTASLVPRSGCLERLADGARDLSGVRKRVAEKIVADPWTAQGMSISALADWSGASENAISRLSLAVGYSGYREFVQALSMDLGKSMGYYHVHPESLVDDVEHATDGVLGLVRRVVGLEINSMQDTLANLSEPTLRHVVSAMAKARQVVLLGTGTAAPLCLMMSYRLASVGLSAAWTNDPMMMFAEVNRLERHDLLIAVSFSGRSRDTVQATAFARSRGIPTVGVTTDPHSPISTVTDTTLTIFSSSIEREEAQFSARVAGMALLEAIATAVSVERAGRGGAVPGLQELGAAQDEFNTLPSSWKNQL